MVSMTLEVMPILRAQEVLELLMPLVRTVSFAVASSLVGFYFFDEELSRYYYCTLSTELTRGKSGSGIEFSPIAVGVATRMEGALVFQPSLSSDLSQTTKRQPTDQRLGKLDD